MFEEKESFWKKKGFYVSACVLLVAIMAVGVIYSRQVDTKGEDKLLANIATEVPEATATPSKEEKEVKQANAGVSQNIVKKPENQTSSDKEQDITKKPEEKKETQKKEEVPNKDTTEKKKDSTQTKAVTATANHINYSFDVEKGLLWPVKGDVILKYSITNTIYFKTLAQYKCNPGIVISAKEGSKVKSAANCRVTKIEKSDELGLVVTTDIGSGYTVSYGQLDNISVNKGDELKEGDVIGTIAAPTKYYSEEGSNLYFQVNEGKETVDPLLLLR